MDMAGAGEEEEEDDDDEEDDEEEMPALEKDDKEKAKA